MRTSIPLCLIAALISVSSAQPAINPLDPEAGSFLDFPLDSTRRAAGRAYQAGLYEEAALRYLEALQHDITSSGDIYNLACCYGLLHRDSLSARYLQRAFQAGFTDLEHVRRDPDFDSVRAHPVFAATVDSCAARAELTTRAKGREVLVSAGSFLPAYVHLPDGYDSTRAYPLLVGLHGVGASPDNFAPLYERMGRPDLIFAVLQAPYPISAGRSPGYSWSTGSRPDSTVRPQSALMSAGYVAEAVRQLRARYRTTGAWLLGFSQGCYMAYLTGIRHHDLLQGIIGFGGGLDTTRFSSADYDAAKHLRIFAAHGAEDRVVEPEQGRTASDFLKRRGFNVTYVEFKGGHTVAQEPLRQALKLLNPD